MQHIVLQKLLHAGVLLKNDTHKWVQQFGTPPHINRKDIGYDLMKAYLDDTSKRVQQAMKFYIPQVDADNTLTEVEVAKLVNGVDFFLPYKSTFVQVATSIEYTHTDNLHYDPQIDFQDWRTQNNVEQIADHSAISNVLFLDTGRFDDEGKPLFGGMLWMYDQDQNEMLIDPNMYYYSFRDNGDYTFWIDEASHFHKYTNTTSANDDGTYSSPTLNSVVSTIINIHCKLCLLLTYPQIVDSKSVKGFKNQEIRLSDKFSHTEFLRKPKYEHKVLRLNLFDGKSSGGESTGESSGKAFHAVRKHIRQYKDGKVTFVKAHFRGDKTKGIITKDYEIINRSR